MRPSGPRDRLVGAVTCFAIKRWNKPIAVAGLRKLSAVKRSGLGNRTFRLGSPSSSITEKIARRGQHISGEYGVDPFEFERARDIMVSTVDTLPATMSAREVCAHFAAADDAHRTYPVVDAVGVLVGMVSRADALRWRRGPEIGTDLLGDKVSESSIPIGHPDDTVGHIADIMISTDAARIPITDPVSGALLGLVARKDLLRLRQAHKSAKLERRPFLRKAFREI